MLYEPDVVSGMDREWYVIWTGGGMLCGPAVVFGIDRWWHVLDCWGYVV